MSKKRPMTIRSSNEDDLQGLIERAEGGDSIAQNLLAARLATGNGVVQDNLGCLYWYSEAIKGGYVHAKWNAGSMLIEGQPGLEAFRELGIKLIEEAADANENSACLFLAQCYRNGTFGKSVNDERASHWEERAWDHKKMKEFDIRESLPLEYVSALSRPTIISLTS
jgi:TPR repeat protein